MYIRNLVELPSGIMESGGLCKGAWATYDPDTHDLGELPCETDWMDLRADAFCMVGVIYRAFGVSNFDGQGGEDLNRDTPWHLSLDTEVSEFIQEACAVVGAEPCHAARYNVDYVNALMDWSDGLGCKKVEVVAALRRTEVSLGYLAD